MFPTRDGSGGSRHDGPPGIHTVHADRAPAAGAPHDAADAVPVQPAAVIGGQALVSADVVEVGRRPCCQERDQFRVQRHVAVVAELAQRDARPVAGADAHDDLGPFSLVNGSPAGVIIAYRPLPRRTAFAPSR
jgi:hypothetical protein